MRRRVVQSLILCWGVVSGLIAILVVNKDRADASNHQPRIGRRCVGQWFNNTIRSNNNNNNTNPSLPSSEVDLDMGDGRGILRQLQKSTTCDSKSVSTSSASVGAKNDNRRADDADGTQSNNNKNNNNGYVGNNTNEGWPYHVMMLLSDQHDTNDMITTLAAGFLTAGLHVTVVNFHDDDDDGRSNRGPVIDVSYEILSRIAIEDEERADRSLAVIDVPLPILPNDDGIHRNHIINSLAVDDNHDETAFVADDCGRKTTSEPFDDCAIRRAPIYLRLLKDVINDTTTSLWTLGMDPDVLVTDAAFMGGLLFSEVQGIPTVAIGTYQTLDLAVEHDVSWTPPPDRMLPYRMYRIVLQRLYSLSLTGAFLKTNRIRKQLGLQALKSPTDGLLPIVALLVEYVSTDSWPPFASGVRQNGELLGKPSSPSLSATGRRHTCPPVFYIQPLVAPCTPCIEGSPTWTAEKNTPIVVVEPPQRTSPRYIRSLIRSLTLARQSLDAYDECSWDSFSCRKDAPFEVVWLQKRTNESSDDAERYFPPSVPSFIHREMSTNILDSVIRHPNTVAAIAHCNSDSHTVSTLGVGFLCLSHSSRIPPPPLAGTPEGDDESRSIHSVPPELGDMLDPREVATQLLRILRKKSREVGNSKTRKRNAANRIPHGIEATITVVSAVARTHRENKPWKNLSEMQETMATSIREAMKGVVDKNDGGRSVDSELDTRSLLDLRFDEQQPYDAFTVLVAWVVFLSALIYVIMKDSIARWRRRRSHHRGDSFSDGILTRLPDLDEAWDTLLVWYRDQPALVIAESFALSSAHDDNQNIKSTSGATSGHHATTPQQGNHSQQHHQHHNQGHVRRRRKVRTTRQ